jgi:hypothetical protein
MKKIIIGVFVLTLLVSTSVYAERGRGDKEGKTEDGYITSTRSEVLKLFREKVDFKNTVISFDDRVKLESGIRALGDVALTKKWETFVESSDVKTAKKNAKELEAMLSNKINTGKNKNATSTKDVLKNVDATCVSAAVSEREDAIMSAWTAFNMDITTTLITRKSSLVNAWALTDAKERRSAVKDAWATAKKDRKEIAAEYKKVKKDIWAEFKVEAKKCGGSEGIDASGESESSEKVEI